MKNLDTVWTSQAADGQTLKEYPRPGMVRGRWINLNGMWDYLITDSRILPWQFYENEYFPFDGQILVPFSPEAPLSQVNRQLLPDETLWYSRVIQLPEGSFDPTCQRLLLHFGAVDQICSVYINGKFVTYHKRLPSILRGYYGFCRGEPGYFHSDQRPRLQRHLLPRKRQTAAGKRRHVLYRTERNLADCVDGDCARGLHKRSADHPGF